MKLAHIAFVIGAVFASQTAFAGTITGSPNVNFLAFDGQKIKKNASLQVNDSEQHQVVVEVSSIYQSGSDDQFFESQPIVVTFNGSQEDIKILAPNLQNSTAVSQFKKAPQLQVQTVSGQPLAYKMDYLKGGEGFLPNANINENLANYNAGKNIASVAKFSVVSMAAIMSTTNNKATKGKVMVQGENIAEQQLQYWFQQADKETQKRFLDWAKKQ